MDTSSSVGIFSEKVRASQPSSKEEKVAKQETVSSSQPFQEHSVDINA